MILYDNRCPRFRNGEDPNVLPVICGDLDDSWVIRVNGKDRRFVPVVKGEHDGYESEQPVILVDDRLYRVGLCVAILVRTQPCLSL